MTKGTYQVNDGENPNKAQPKDTSYKSCICALLFVLVICIIILVATSIWSPRRSKSEKTVNGELLGLEQEKNIKNTTAKIIMQTEATTTEHYNNSGHGVIQTTTEKNQSSVTIPVKNENFSITSDYGITPETQTENVETTTTRENESTSTDDHSTDAYLSVSVSSKHQHTTFNPNDDITSETQTENVETTTTEKNKSASTEAYYDTESSVSVSSKYHHSTLQPDDDITSETQTENIEETTTIENESTSTDDHLTESSVSVSVTSKIQTKIAEQNTTEENESNTIDDHSTEAYYDIESSVSVSSKYRHSTILPDDDMTSITQTDNVQDSTKGEIENSSTENIGSSFSSVRDVIINREAQSVSTNKPTTESWSTDDYDYYSIDVETTTPTPVKNEKSPDDFEYTIPNDSSGSSYLFYNEPVSSTTQISVQQALNNQVVNTSDICPCKTVASRMLNLMNHSEDPCEDFYEFACGEMRVHDNNKDTWDRLSKEINLISEEALPHFKALKKFYTSCVEHEKVFNYTDRILQVTELVKEVGWIIDGKADQSKVNLTSLFAKLILRQSLPIFDVEVDLDSETKTFILKLLPQQMHSLFAESGRWSGLSEGQIRCLIAERDALQSPKLNLNRIHLSYLDCQKDQGIYLNSVQSVVENLGLYSNTVNWYNKSQLIKELRTSIEWKFLTFLQELPSTNMVRETLLFKKPDQDYDVMSVRNLQDKYPLVDWKILFEMITGNTIAYDTQIETYYPNYIKNVFDELQTSSTIEINNALVSMYAHSLYQNLVIPQARHHREDYCLKLSTKLFQDVSNNLYFKTWKNADFVNYRKYSLEIFNQLKTKFKTEVETQAKWLDGSSKESLLRKLDNIKLIVTEEKDSYNYGSYLQPKYQIEFSEKNWSSNAVKMVTEYRRMLYSIQGSKFTTEKLWSFFINAYDSTPTSIYSMGLTVAPLGTMKKYTKNVPNYITMMKIGLPLAREIGHHFDHDGIVNGMHLFESSWDYYNYMNNIMNNNTLNASMSVGNQEISFDVEPKLSANERIADNTAVKLLSGLYNENDNPGLPWISTSYPKQKLFYILVAQEYCSRISMPEFMQKLFESEVLPSTLRVKNIVTNSEEFSRTFECSPTAKVNDGVSHKIQFPYLDNLDIQKYYNSLQ